MIKHLYGAFFILIFNIIMKKLLYLFSFVILISCTKESTDDNDNLSGEQNISNVSYGNDGAQKMDVYLPEKRSSDTTKLLVLIHGGAWSEDDKSFFTIYMPRLKEIFPNYAIANINYRLATTNANHFPTQENDVKAAVDFLMGKSNEYEISKKIVLLGVSAGAHLALLQAYKNPSPKIAAVIDFFGPTDMVALYNSTTAGFNQFAFELLMGGTPATNPSIYQQSSPINFVSTQSPPTLILHGTLDDYVDISHSIALKNKLASFGVTTQMITYPGEGHGWYGAKMDDAFIQVQSFIKANVP